MALTLGSVTGMAMLHSLGAEQNAARYVHSIDRYRSRDVSSIIIILIHYQSPWFSTEPLSRRWHRGYLLTVLVLPIASPNQSGHFILLCSILPTMTSAKELLSTFRDWTACVVDFQNEWRRVTVTKRWNLSPCQRPMSYQRSFKLCFMGLARNAKGL